MYKFGRTSTARLGTLHPDLQKVCRELIKYVDFTVVEGHRDEARQQSAFRSGASTVQWPNSKHNKRPSEAVDIAPWSKDLRGIDWEDVAAISNLIGRFQQIADQLLISGEISHEIRWGGDWDRDGRTRDQKFMDYVHVELVALPGS